MCHLVTVAQAESAARTGPVPALPPLAQSTVDKW